MEELHHYSFLQETDKIYKNVLTYADQQTFALVSSTTNSEQRNADCTRQDVPLQPQPLGLGITSPIQQQETR